MLEKLLCFSTLDLMAFISIVIWWRIRITFGPPLVQGMVFSTPSSQWLNKVVHFVNQINPNMWSSKIKSSLYMCSLWRFKPFERCTHFPCNVDHISWIQTINLILLLLSVHHVDKLCSVNPMVNVTPIEEKFHKLEGREAVHQTDSSDLKKVGYIMKENKFIKNHYNKCFHQGFLRHSG